MGCSIEGISRCLRTLLIAGALGLGTGCVSDDDDDDDTGMDGDAGGDSDTDTGSDPYEECPLNSGWPCTCEASADSCEDGNDCIVPEGSEGFGVCAIACNGMAENYKCSSIGEWGASGACMFAAGGVIGQGMGQHCGVLCLWEGNSGPCPPGQECIPTTMTGADICVP